MEAQKVASSLATRSFTARWSALALLAALGSVSSVRSLLKHSDSATFPQHMGTYTLSREWDEQLASGQILFHWIEYISTAGGPMISIGIAPILRPEDALRSLTARREGRLWRGEVMLGAATLDGSFFADGVTQSLETSTVCDATTCGVYTSAGSHLVYSLPNAWALLTQTPSRPVSIVLKTETLDTAIAPAQARQDLSQILSQFPGSARIFDWTAPYR